MQSKMTVGTKLTLISGGLATVTMAVGLVALASLSTLNTKIEAIVTDPLPGMAKIAQAEAAVYEWRGNAWRHVAVSDPAQMAALDRQMAKLRVEAEAAVKEYAATVITEEDRSTSSKIGPALTEYLTRMESALTLSRSLQKPEAVSQANVAAVYFAPLRAALQATSNYNRRAGERLAAEAKATFKTTWWILIITALVGMSVGCGSAGVVIFRLNKSLRTAVRGLSSGSDEVASASAQLASSSNSLAQASSEQAASIEEVSASSTMISGQAADNERHAESAATLVTSSQKSFLDADRELDQMVEAMGAIKAQGNKIAKIIKVIDEIAFQTNLLALNAAVEAARAGESGMGFAVVADEVRSLSHRCAEAARDTTALIEESITKTNDGKNKVDSVARTIRSITGEVAQVQALVVQVQSGSKQQGQGIRQVAASISQMQQVTQTTAASAEQGAAAAQELTAQSENLNGIVADLAALVGR